MKNPRITSRGTVAVTTALAAALLLAAGGAQVAAGPAMPALAGNYRFVGGDPERKQIEDACEVAIADSNFIVRAVARRRLKPQVAPWDTLTFRWAGTDLEFGVNGRPGVGTHLNGDAISTTSPTGDPMKMRQWFEGKKLVQVFELEVGTRRNEVTLGPDGNQLKMKVQISSSQLPKPVIYELTYKRGG